MPVFQETRVLRLSWRPASDEFGAPVQTWISRLKKRISVLDTDGAGRKLEVHDVATPGADRAAAREGPWTDFVAVFTMDYCAACSQEGEASELHDALLRVGEDELRFWVVRLEDGDPAAASVAGRRPWATGERWSVLPHDSEPPLTTQPPQLVDPDLERRCLKPIRDA